MNRIDWALLTIAAGGYEPLTPVVLQKSLFIVGKNCADVVAGTFYQFEPWDYGPFDADVYDDARELEELGLIARPHVVDRQWRDFRITRAGLCKARELRASVPPDVLRYISTVVKWAQELTFTQLVRAVITRYPEMGTAMVFPVSP